jgi:hypothetical protein
MADSGTLARINDRIRVLSSRLEGVPGEVLKCTRPDEYARLKRALDGEMRAYFLALFDETTASLP